MPYIWAKKVGKLDDEFPISTTNMFYPAGLSITRKGKLSLIWLAANYDPDKYRKMIPPRKCEEANIEHICTAIMNPAEPYALRLSAQLLLGTVRVYRTKTKLILEMAEQMILKLSSLISLTSTRTYDMPVAMLRADAITIADTGMSIIDYSLEPVYYDPQMIMHMNEEDFFTVSGSPLQSPIKIEKKSPSKVSTKSPIVVSNSKISFQEDLLSPSKPIQVPAEEEDFGVLGFGPAQDNFLADLMEIADINFNPKALDFGDEEESPVRLEPVLEEDETLAVAINQVPEQELPTDGGASVLRDKISRKRKVEDEDESRSITSDTAGQITDLDQLLKDAIEINETLRSSAEDVFGKEGDAEVEKVQQTSEDVAARQEELYKQVSEEIGEQVAAESAFVIEPVAGKIRSQSESSSVAGVPGVPMDWAANLETPSETINLKPVPSQRKKKKRKLMVDKEIFIESKEMKNNFATPEKLTRIPIIAGTAFPTGKEMFSLPILENKLTEIKFWWENNTVRDEGDPIAVLLPQDIPPELEDIQPPSVGPPSVGPTEIFDEPMEEDIVEKEVPMEEKAAEPLTTPAEEKMLDEAPHKSLDQTTGSRFDVTPSSIAKLRDGSGNLKSFEYGGTSIGSMKETPPAEVSKSSIDNNVDDVTLMGLPQSSPRISGVGLLPPGALEEEVSELDVVLEQDEKSVDFTAGWLDDADILTSDYKASQRKISHSLRTSEKTVFQRLFPSSRTNRRDTALALYLALNMHKNGYVELSQTELFGDIVIRKGRIS